MEYEELKRNICFKDDIKSMSHTLLDDDDNIMTGFCLVDCSVLLKN